MGDLTLTCDKLSQDNSSFISPIKIRIERTKQSETKKKWVTQKKERKSSFSDALNVTPWKAVANTRPVRISSACGAAQPAEPQDSLTLKRIRRKASNGDTRLWTCISRIPRNTFLEPRWSSLGSKRRKKETTGSLTSNERLKHDVPRG